MKINIVGRTDTKDYFASLREFKKLAHHPFIVFTESKDEVSIEIIDSPTILISFPPSTKVMAQWGGQWRSDFFQFTVGDFQEYLKQNPKKEYQVI